MSKSSHRRAVDISNRRTEPKLGWRVNLLIWGSVIALYFAMTYFDVPVWWMIAALVPLAIIGFIAPVVWKVVIKRGTYTWMRLARQPARLMESGDAAAAEAACVKALARARRFADDDHRRGLMLCELAMYVKFQGRMAEAIGLYEECVTIMAQQQDKEPFDYFVALNNYGICFIHLKDFERAQRILEKAIDLTLAARKREGNSLILMSLPQVQALQFVMHLNLAFLMMEMHELAEAEVQLREADALEPVLSKGFHAAWHDHYIAMCALWEIESGKFAAADSELAQAHNPDFPSCLRARAKLHLARQQFAEAERLLRKYQQAESKKGTLHLPDKLKPTLEFAESLFGQGKHNEAFAELQEARSIVADFAVPADEDWRKALTIWLQRAKDLGKVELAASLEKEIAQIPAVTTSCAVTILGKFQPQAPG